MIRFLDNLTSPSNWKNIIQTVSPIDLFNKNQYGKLKSFYQNHGMAGTAKELFGGYLEGKTPFGKSPRSLEDTIFARKVAMGIGGGLLAANALLPDSFISRQGTFAAQAVGHSAITRALYAKNKVGGAAYGLWAGMNALSSGNQVGPF